MWLSRNVLQTTNVDFLDEVSNNYTNNKRNNGETFTILRVGLSKMFSKSSCKTNTCTCQKNNYIIIKVYSKNNI